MGRPTGPGTPRLLRALNDRAALELLLAGGPMTRAQIGERTGLSKVTASQLVERLEQRGLVGRVGVVAGGRGPNAQLYAVVPDSAYVVGLEVGPTLVSAMCADITGAGTDRVEVAADVADDPVGVVRAAVVRAARRARVPLEKIRQVVLGTPGVVDPTTGEIAFAWDLPRWHRGLLAALREDLRRPVRIFNDVNLAAIAEYRTGAARGIDDFVLVWADRGIGLGMVIDGRLHQGSAGAAGELGYLPVPELPGATHGVKGFQRLAGAEAVAELARSYQLPADSMDGTAAGAIRAAADAGDAGAAFLGELAHRLAFGVAAVSVVLDPTLVVLAGSIGQAGGQELARRVEEEARALAPVVLPRVVSTAVPEDPVLRGALLTALDAAREEVFEAATEATAVVAE